MPNAGATGTKKTAYIGTLMGQGGSKGSDNTNQCLPELLAQGSRKKATNASASFKTLLDQ